MLLHPPACWSTMLVLRLLGLLIVLSVSLCEIQAFLLSIKPVDKEQKNELQCDVHDTAPDSNLNVSWHKDNKVVRLNSFNTSETSVNKISDLEEEYIQIRCEALLEPEPQQPQHPVVSQTHNLSALYAPDVSLTCEIGGNPLPEYQSAVEGTDLLIYSLTFNIINITSSAIFKCMAISDLGNVTLNIEVYMSIERTTTTPSATKPPREDIILSTKTTNASAEETLYQLQCDVFSTALAQNLTLIWFKNNENIATNHFHETTIETVNVSDTLDVRITREEDVVQFRCEALLEEINYLLISETHNLSALYAPEFRANHSNHITLHQGGDVSLSCEADGNPPPQYRWAVDGMNLRKSSWILNVTDVNHSRNYSCIAINDLGKVSLEIYVHVLEATPAASPEATPTPATNECILRLTPPEVVVKFGDPVAINCSSPNPGIAKIGWETPVNPVSHRSSSVLWKIEKMELWTLDLQCFGTLNNNDQCFETPNIIVYQIPDIVSISAAGPMKEGLEYQLNCDIYNVAVKNLTVTCFHGNKTVFTETSQSSSGTPRNVTFIWKFTPKKSDNGSVFRCMAELHPGPGGPVPPPSAVSEPFLAVVHYKPVLTDCSPVHPIIENKFRMNDMVCKIDANPQPSVKWYRDDKLISSSELLNRTHSGIYTAEVSNSMGNTSKSVLVQVEYGPSFTCKMEYEVEVSDKPQILCEPEGLPPPNVTWFKNGKEMVLPSHWSKRDSGNYSLKAQNIHGTAEHKFQLSILYAPEFKEGDIQKDLMLDSNMTFDCEAEGNPRPVIKWTYKPAHNLMETTVGRQNIITVSGATSTNAGLYICVATNKVGNMTRTITLAEKGRTSTNFFYWFIPLICIIIILIIVLSSYIYRCKRKKGKYTVVSKCDPSSIPMATRSAPA